MKNMIISGTGNSRKIKTSLPENTTWADALAMMRAGTFPIDLNGVNSSGISQEGTPLNKDTLMPDALATAIQTLTGEIFSQEPTPANQMHLLVNFLGNNAVSRNVTASVDINDVTKTGYYVFDLSIEELTHFPEDLPRSGQGYLLALANSITPSTQKMVQILAAASGIWVRTKSAGTFGAWLRMASFSNLATTSANGLMSAADKAMMENSVVRGSKPAPTGATSLDDFTTSGIYWVSSSTYASGWPTGESGYAMLNVFFDGGGARLQELTMYDGNGLNRRYCRMYINAQWYVWRPIATGAGTAWGLDQAPQITANSDLNNLKTPGNYTSPGNVTSTLTNAPPVASNAFILKVMVGHLSNTWVQMAIDVTGAAMFLRYFNRSTWGSWYKYSGTAV